MKARICDICGQVIRVGLNGKPSMIIKAKSKDAYGHYKKLELCSNCMYNLVTFCRRHRGDADVDDK